MINSQDSESFGRLEMSKNSKNSKITPLLLSRVSSSLAYFDQFHSIMPIIAGKDSPLC